MTILTRGERVTRTAFQVLPTCPAHLNLVRMNVICVCVRSAMSTLFAFSAFGLSFTADKGETRAHFLILHHFGGRHVSASVILWLSDDKGTRCRHYPSIVEDHHKCTADGFGMAILPLILVLSGNECVRGSIWIKQINDILKKTERRVRLENQSCCRRLPRNLLTTLREVCK